MVSPVKLLTTLVFDSFSGNSLVYLIVLFRQKCRLISVIVVVGLANLSCCCDHCVNVANKPDKNNVRQRTPPSGAPSLSLRRAGRREPWEGGCRERTRGGGRGASVQSCYTGPSVISSKMLKSRHLRRVPNYDKFVNAQTTLWPL